MTDLTDLEYQVLQLGARLRRLSVGCPGNPSATSKRFAAGQSLKAVIDFIDAAFVDGQDLRFALAEMLHGLSNVEHGHPTDWFSNQVGHRSRGAPTEIATMRGYAAAFVELLHRKHGMSLRDAYLQVFQQIPTNSSIFKDVPSPSWKTIRRWRQERCVGAVGATPEKAAFENLLSLAKRQPEIANQIKRSLKNLRLPPSIADASRDM